MSNYCYRCGKSYGAGHVCLPIGSVIFGPEGAQRNLSNVPPEITFDLHATCKARMAELEAEVAKQQQWRGSLERSAQMYSDEKMSLEAENRKLRLELARYVLSWRKPKRELIERIAELESLLREALGHLEPSDGRDTLHRRIDALLGTEF